MIMKRLKPGFVAGTLGLLGALAAVLANAQQPDTSPTTNEAVEMPAAKPVTPPDRTAPLPEGVRDVGIDEHLDERLPLEATFTDHDGNKVKLGDYFDGEHPVILTLNYYRCPMLCGLQLNGMVDALREIDWKPGQQFEIVTISFDPLETQQLAHLKRKTYLEYYGDPAAAAGWHFLVGSQKNIAQALDATGYRIAWNEARREWAHAAALIIATPDGRISRYLYGITYKPKTVRLSLVEASEGKIGTTVDKILLYCFHYDGEGYSLAAFNVARGVAVLTMIVVGGLLLGLWLRERRRGKAVTSTT